MRFVVRCGGWALVGLLAVGGVQAATGTGTTGTGTTGTGTTGTGTTGTGTTGTGTTGTGTTGSGPSDAFGPCVDVGQAFEDVTGPAGVGAYGNSKGVTLNDFDEDGDLDMFVAQGPTRVEGAVFYPSEDLLYINQGGLRFTEEGGAWGVDGLCEDRSPMFGDLDNDGLADLYIAVNGRNVLLRRTGALPGDHHALPFEDVTDEAGQAGHIGWGHQGFLFDYDRDGFLDVFFTNGPEDGSTPNALLRNQGDGTLRDVSSAVAIGGSPSGKGTCVLDVNLDGWLDVFVTTGREYNNQLWMNQGDGTFVDEAAARGVLDPQQRFGVGTVCEDLDNDGDPDIALVTHDQTYSGNQLFENRDGVFVDVAPLSGLAEFIDGHGLDAVDLDLDGLQDIVMSGIGTPPHIFLNRGGLEFERLCNGGGASTVNGVTWSVVSADLDGDAYPEVLVSHGLGRRPRENVLFRNLGTAGPWAGNHFLTVEVQGVTHNPSQLGARVEVFLGEQVLTRWVGDWSSFDSQGPLALTFGLGRTTAVDRVRVTFTNGVVEELTGVVADQRLVVVEPAARADDDADGVPDEWDACPGTRLGHRTDAEGCTPTQRSGLGLALATPDQDAVVTELPTFTWSSSDPGARFVVQVGTDGTFGPAGRLDWGPVSDTSYTPTAAQWDELDALMDGSAAGLWRVVALTADGAQAQTDPRRIWVAEDTNVVRTPYGVSVFQPPHVVVDAGAVVTFWNDGVAAGNLQNEIHDVQLLDPYGRAVSVMKELNGSGQYTHTFTTPGTWSYLCHRHSGVGTHSDGNLEGLMAPHHVGPYRCMAGTVTVR